jgi:hypothetical protein
MTRRTSLALATFILLGACAAAEPRDTWERPDDRSRASARDISGCMSEAQRRTAALYPVLPPEEQARMPAADGTFRLPLQMGFYNDCMRRKGFVRIAPHPTRGDELTEIFRHAETDCERFASRTGL